MTDENDLYAVQADLMGAYREVPVLGMVYYNGKLIILDALSSMAFEDKIGKEEFEKLPFLSADMLFDYDELMEHIEDY